MNFYYRTLSDGRCEVVCTHCFLTVGVAWGTDRIRQIENSHTCLAKSPSVSKPSPGLNSGPQLVAVPPAFPAVKDTSNSRVVRNAGLLCVVAALLYVVPKLLEFNALHKWNPWISVVVPGDLAGCLCLAIVFRKIKAGVLLYCLLTGAEACLFWLRVTPNDILPWIADLVPTLVISMMVLGSAGRTRRLISTS